MSKRFGWGLAVPLVLVLAVWGCDKGDSGNESGGGGGGGAAGGGGGGENPLTQEDHQQANMYTGEAGLPKWELAERDIRGMMDRSRGYYERFMRFPDSAPLTPAEVPCGPQGTPLDESQWQNPTWQSLRFVPRDPFNYSYQYDTTGTGEPGSRFVVTAIGDLDCDGDRSTLQRGATLQADGVIASDSEVSETNRDE